MFGDYEPEDAWCTTDTVAELVTNLRRRVAALDGGPLTQSETFEQLERRTLEFVNHVNRDLTPAELSRAVLLIEDVEQLRARVRGGG